MSALDFISKYDTVIAALILIPVAIWIIYKNNQRPLKNWFKIVIFRENHSPIYRQLKTELNRFSITIGNNIVYEASTDQAWKIEPQLLDKFLNRVAGRYLFLFRAPTIDPKTKKPTDPEILSRAAIPINSSEVLYKVKKYRGVRQGIEDQFRQPSSFNVPPWALIVVLIALLLLGVVLADQLGLLEGIRI